MAMAWPSTALVHLLAPHNAAGNATMRRQILRLECRSSNRGRRGGRRSRIAAAAPDDDCRDSSGAAGAGAAGSGAGAEDGSEDGRRFFDNRGRPLSFIALGRPMQLALSSQHEFEQFLHKCGAYGVVRPDEPAQLKQELCQLDPRDTWLLVDTHAMLRFAKALARQEAERDSAEYPPGMLDCMFDDSDDDSN